jgi:hypothetical protein
LKPFRVFRVGEVVAYESTENASDNASAVVAGGESKEATRKVVRYGRVIATSESGDAGVRRVTVKLNAETTTSVLATDIMSFKVIDTPT